MSGKHNFVVRLHINATYSKPCHGVKKLQTSSFGVFHGVLHYKCFDVCATCFSSSYILCPLFLLSVLCLHHSSCHMHKGFVISEACGLAHVRRACSLTKVRETQQSCVLHINATVRIFLRHNIKKLQTARLEFLLA